MRLKIGLSRRVDLVLLNAVHLDKAYKMSLSGKISARGIASLTIAVAGCHPKAVEVELAVVLTLSEKRLTIMPSCSVSNWMTGLPPL